LYYISIYLGILPKKRYIHRCSHTGCPILIYNFEYFLNYPFYGKIVGTKNIQDRRVHKLVLTLTLTLRWPFKVIWKSRSFFSMRTPIFDPGFGKNRKFYVQNDILKIFYMTFKDQIQIKCLKTAVELFFWVIMVF